MPLVKVSDITYETIRRLAFEGHISQGEVVADALITHLDRLNTTITQANLQHTEPTGGDSPGAGCYAPV